MMDSKRFYFSIFFLISSIKLSHQFDNQTKEVFNGTYGNCNLVKGIWTHWTAQSSCGCQSKRSSKYRMCYSQRRIVEVERVESSCNAECPLSNIAACDSWNSAFCCSNDVIGGINVEKRECNQADADLLRLRYCEDIYFAVEFLRDTRDNVPRLTNPHFPSSTDGISVCFWCKAKENNNEWKSVFLYDATDVWFQVWIVNNTMLYIQVRSSEVKTSVEIENNKWNHVCWVLDSARKWLTYLNGKSKAEENLETSFLTNMQNTTGYLIIGQDVDGIGETIVNQASNTFFGELTEMYLYHTTLTADEVLSVYQHAPTKKNIVVGWWQFKGKTSGTDIIETIYPF